jgi:PTH1 family peptidyl-tRNA hydrolase
MNLSGQSVLACAQFYKIPLKNIIIISDDIDMAFGKIRYRATGNA